jgi:DNA-binding transcriptional LysR family regulator
MAAPGDRFRDIRLFEDRFACLLRRDHPAIKAAGKIDAWLLAELPHLHVSSTGQGDRFHRRGVSAPRPRAAGCAASPAAGDSGDAGAVGLGHGRGGARRPRLCSQRFSPGHGVAATLANLDDGHAAAQADGRSACPSWLRGVIRGVCRAF